MPTRLAVVIVTVCLCAVSLHAQAPPAAPNLTRQQRDLLKAIVAAVDGAAAQAETADLDWQSHIMRASDGSHYVAFSVQPPSGAALPRGPVILYLRLATATPAGTSRRVERSPMREWLAGSRVDPRLLPSSRGIAIGEMPIMGAAGGMTFRPPTSTGMNEMKLMALERERARQQKEDEEKQRRNELEGKAVVVRDILPFEDFDLLSQSVRPSDGARVVTRAFTAGPGDYDLYLGWADPSAAKPIDSIRVLRKSVRLEPARTAGLITSSVILADSISMRPAPYSPAEQGSHPYSIGVMEIVPRRSARYGREDSLSLAFQVINAQANDAGMPDVGVSFRVVRMTGGRETPVASLKPQNYDSTTLPPDFDLRLGHPLFAAVTAPLTTLLRGDYRLQITVNDRVATTSVNTDIDFSVIATPAALLAEAPALGAPFKRETVLVPSVLGGIIDALSPPSPSPALARAFGIAKTSSLANLLVEEPVPASEAGIRTALTGLALLSIGDASAAAQFQRALQQNAPAAPTQFLLGAARAMQGRDSDAIVAWQTALDTNHAPPLTAELLLQAYLRRNDLPKATALAGAATQQTAEWSRLVAATLIAGKRETEAVSALTTHLAATPDDLDARWLLLHALYAQFVQRGPSWSTADAARFAGEARTYLDAKGPHAALADEWLRQVTSK